MTVSVFRSDDVGAPALTGMPGSLIALLDACLLNGYGSKAAVGGWTKAFSGTNTAAYKMPAGSTGFYMAIDDTGAPTPGFAKMIGYENMTAVLTGTMPMPSVGNQASYTPYVYKSLSIDLSARDWVMITNGTIIYLWINPDGMTQNTNSSFICFGDFLSYKGFPYDAYRCVHMSWTSSAIASAMGYVISTSISTPSAQNWVMRGASGTAGSVACVKLADASKSSAQSILGSNGLMYPNPGDNKLYMSPIFIGDHLSLSLRGELPGIWCPLHMRPLGHYDTFDGSGPFAGKTFLVLAGHGNGQVFFETSDTW